MRNGQHGVLIDAEGDRDAIARFLDELQSTAPSLARLRHLTVSWTTPHHDDEVFRIDTSSGEGSRRFSPLRTWRSAPHASRKWAILQTDGTTIRS